MFEKEAEEYVKKEGFRSGMFGELDDITSSEANKALKQAFLAGLKAGKPQWHKLDWKKDFPDVDKLVRVRTKSDEEYICQTYLYYPTEDEIGYGSVIIQFEELNGDWVDDNEIEYWCEIPTFDKE